MQPVHPYVFLASVVVLAVMLFYPVNRLIWVSKMRRFERKQGRKSTPEEQLANLRISRLVTGVIVIVFSFLFNRVLWYS